MSKTYTLQATLNTGRLRNSDWASDSWTKFFYNSDDPVGYSGYDSPRYYATNMMFNQTTLASLRSKVSNGITVSALTLQVNCVQPMTGETYIGYKYNSTASGNSSSEAWARSTNVDNPGSAGDTGDTLAYIIPAQSLSTGTQTFNLYRADPDTGVARPFSGIPKYGLVAGPRRLVSGRWRFDSATLYVTTNETDYSYTLAYNVNGGSGTFSNQTGSNTGTSPSYTFTISSTVPTRAGYTFLGWSTSSSATSASYSPGGSITVTSSGTTTLYAIWKIITYTVSYNVNGGSGSFASQTKNYGGSFNIHSTKPTPPSPTSAGSYTVTYNANGGSVSPASASAARTTSYTFSVWNTAQNGSGTSYAAGATYSANASATLYAQYTSSTTTASVSLASNVSRTGYNFNGWYTAASGGTRVGGAGSAYTPTGNVTLYAQWTASSATLSSVTSSVDCGNNLTGSWTSTGSTYKYKLKVTCGNAAETWSSLTAANASSATVQIPTSWYSMDASLNGPLRDTTSATATCTLYTYASDGTTQIGTTSSKTFTVKVPTSVVPSLSTLSAASSSDNAVVSGWGSTVFVQGYSKVTLTQSVSSYNGSRFSSVRYSGLGLDSTKTGSLASSDPSSVINSAGTFTYTATVTDTRGRSASKTVSVTFQPYAQPSIAGIAVVRCDSDGTVNNSAGAYFKATPVYSFSSVSSNNALVTQNIKYRVHPNGAWSTATTCASGSTYGPWSALLTNSYDVMVTLADRIQNGSSQTTTFTTTLPTVQGLWFGKGNDRLGLGGVPEGPGLYCDWDATFKGVVDVVPRRCEAQLPTSGNSAGWYRVLTLSGDSVDRPLGSPSFVIDITIVRQYGSTNNELHKVSLLAVYNSIAFANETSKSNNVVVDKIRYTRNGKYGYIDIHYDTSALNVVTVRFDVKASLIDYQFAATTPTAVADSPSGETVVTTYEFTANGIRTVTLTSAHSSVTINGQKVARSGNVVSLWVDFTVSAAISGYGYLINTPTFATAANALVYNSYITVQNVRLYADEGNSGLRCYGEFPAGRYIAFITYITTDV